VPEEISAGGIVARLDHGKVLVALIQEDQDPRYVLPKGGIDPGETIEQAARREIAEEAGLTELILLADLGKKERLTYAKKAWKKTYYFLFVTNQVHGSPTDRSQRYELLWAPIDRLPNLIWPEQKALIDFNRDLMIKLVQTCSL
jgi:8-oxo-dGTP pyrophosphatase MutT (NUDIX family)